MTFTALQEHRNSEELSVQSDGMQTAGAGYDREAMPNMTETSKKILRYLSRAALGSLQCG
jgi:hypothetical protein